MCSSINCKCKDNKILPYMQLPSMVNKITLDSMSKPQTANNFAFAEKVILPSISNQQTPIDTTTNFRRNTTSNNIQDIYSNRQETGSNETHVYNPNMYMPYQMHPMMYPTMVMNSNTPMPFQGSQIMSGAELQYPMHNEVMPEPVKQAVIDNEVYISKNDLYAAFPHMIMQFERLLNQSNGEERVEPKVEKKQEKKKRKNWIYTNSRHICKFCKKPFPSESTLSTHVNIHLDLKPYECRICEKKFNAKQNWKRHETIVHKQDHSS